MRVAGVTVSVPLDVRDGVIGIGGAAGGDCVEADTAGRCGGRAEGGLGVEAGRSVAVDEARVTGRQGRQRCAVDLGLVVGGDRQRRRGDGQRPGDVADAVVGVDRAAGGDGVGAAGDMAGGGGRRRQRGLGRQAGRRVAIDEAGVAGRERRQCRAVDLGLVVGRDRQRRGGDGEGSRPHS